MVKFPDIRRELLQMLDEEQAELRSFPQKYDKLKTQAKKDLARRTMRKRCHQRGIRVFEMLEIVGTPTISNIGADGSRAAGVIVLHSYLSLMKSVLGLYEECFKQNPQDIYFGIIPALKDRIQILEHKQQIYGTNWFTDKDDKPFLVQVQDFGNVNKLRASYGLGPVMRPANLAIGAEKYPMGIGIAKASDQKELSDEEYSEYSEYAMTSLLNDLGDT